MTLINVFASYVVYCNIHLGPAYVKWSPVYQNSIRAASRISCNCSCKSLGHRKKCHFINLDNHDLIIFLCCKAKYLISARIFLHNFDERNFEKETVLYFNEITKMCIRPKNLILFVAVPYSFFTLYIIAFVRFTPFSSYFLIMKSVINPIAFPYSLNI